MNKITKRVAYFLTGLYSIPLLFFSGVVSDRITNNLLTCDPFWGWLMAIVGVIFIGLLVGQAVENNY